MVKSKNDDLFWKSLGIDPMAELYFEAALGLLVELTPEQIAELTKMTAEQFAELTPEQMTKYGLENDQFSALTPNKVNFQLFMSGLGIRYTFLLHVHSGRTWQLKRDIETDRLFWSSMD